MINPSDDTLDEMWLSILPPPPKPLGDQSEDDITNWLWHLAEVAQQAHVEDRTLGKDAAAALQWAYHPKNWPYTAGMRMRLQHVYATIFHRLDDEARWKAERDATERSEQARKDRVGLLKEKGWA